MEKLAVERWSQGSQISLRGLLAMLPMTAQPSAEEQVR